jgi:hypothetical protein
MRRLLPVLVLGAMVAAVAPAAAHPSAPLSPTAPTDLTVAMTDNVQYLGRFPEHSGTAGGMLLGDRFYLTDPRGVFVYDVTTPTDPQLLGSLMLPQSGPGVALAQEDPDTNGQILLVDAIDPANPNGGARLQVVDVSDPTAMSVLGSVDVTDHTWTCVSGRVPAGVPDQASDQARERGRSARTVLDTCAFAYGRTGHIVDLRDPSAPVLLEQTWRGAVGYGDRSNSPYTHDLTEIRPGLVMSAGSTNILMDTSDPANPVELTRVEQEGRFSSLGYHSVEWARNGRSPIAVFGTEIAPSGPTNAAGSDCEGDNSVIETWDASGVLAGLEDYEAGASAEEAFANRGFERLDTFDAGSRGLFLQGQAPGHVLYCAHWMEPHPDFDEGGLLVVSYYDRGTRFVEVDADGTMTEVGWVVAAEGYSGSAQWIGDDVVYVMDYRRGLEVVRLLPESATGVRTQGVDVVAASSTVRAVGDPRSGIDPALVSLAVGVLLAGVELLRRARRRTVVR